MERDWCIMAKAKTTEEQLRESGIAKLVLTTGITEAELRALGLTSDGNN
jgi:hypothetical protein